jgi:argininosuccinate lyase
MANVAEALAQEIKRCQELVEEYRKLPKGVGSFAAVMIQRDIDDAVNALASRDVVKIIMAYEAIKGDE